MKAFLKAHRKSLVRGFLGVIGNYWIEVMDDDPIIRKILANTGYQHHPLAGSYLSGLNKRIVLKTFSNDALIILKTQNKNVVNNPCKKVFFVNNSEISPETLLKDARQLAGHRWFNVQF